MAISTVTVSGATLYYGTEAEILAQSGTVGDVGLVTSGTNQGTEYTNTDSGTTWIKTRAGTNGAAHVTSTVDNVSPAANTWTDCSGYIGKVFNALVEGAQNVVIEFSNDGVNPIPTIPSMSLVRQGTINDVGIQWHTNYPAKYFRWTQTGTTSTLELTGSSIALPEDCVTSQIVTESALLLFPGTIAGYIWANETKYDPFVKKVVISAVNSSPDFSCLAERALHYNSSTPAGFAQHTGGGTFNAGVGAGVFDTGISTGGTSTTIVDSSKAWIVSSLIGKWLFHSANQRYRIIGNTATTITVATQTTTPTTTAYEILGTGPGLSVPEIDLGKWGGPVYIQAVRGMPTITVQVWAHRIY